MRQKAFDEIQRDRQREWEANRRRLLRELHYTEHDDWKFPWWLIPVIGLICVFIILYLLGGSSC